MFVPTGRDTLRGLPGLEVLVEGLEVGVERDGLTRTAIQTDVIQRLRANGIVVYASQAENPSSAKPYLYVHVLALKISPQVGYAVAIQVHLRQTLRSLVTESNIVNAMTWDMHNVVAVPTESLQLVLAEIQECVDQFIRDWRAVH
jgi:hypothetical protein